MILSLRCCRCEFTRPVDKFSRDSSTSSGYRAACKDCTKVSYLQRSGPVDSIKRCAVCQVVKPRAAYHRQRSSVGGLQRMCIECQKDFKRDNVELYREIRKKYRDTPAGQIAAYQAAARRRARKAGLPFEPYDPVDIYERESGICYLCGRPVARFHERDGQTVRFFHIEHIIPIAADPEILRSYGIEHPGDVPYNLSIAHPSCNAEKRNRVTPDVIASYQTYLWLYGPVVH